jgi:hypothetical protein
MLTIWVWETPDAEQEPAVRLLVQAALGAGHRHRIARVDVGDSGCDDQLAGAGQQPSRVHQHVAPKGLVHPQRRVAAGFDMLGGVERGRRRHAVQQRPDAKLAQLHVPLPALARPAAPVDDSMIGSSAASAASA